MSFSSSSVRMWRTISTSTGKRSLIIVTPDGEMCSEYRRWCDSLKTVHRLAVWNSLAHVASVQPPWIVHMRWPMSRLSSGVPSSFSAMPATQAGIMPTTSLNHAVE